MSQYPGTPSLKHIRGINQASSGQNAVAVFVGGTSGIGANTAFEFVKHIKSPVCYIVGRDPTAGEQIVQKLKEINSDSGSKYEFIKSDVTLIKECDKLCDTIKSKEGKINLLFLSAGFLDNKPRSETPEGLDKRLSVNYYGRWRIVQQLMPLVEAAAGKSENARVVSVLAAGQEGKIKEDDLDLQHNFSFLNVNKHSSQFNSLAVSRFAKLYPQVSFIHAFPGIVGETGVTREFHWALKYPADFLFKWFATTPQTAGEKFYYMGYSSPDYASGAYLLGGGLEDVKKRADEKGFLSIEQQEKVWKHTESKYNEILGS